MRGILINRHVSFFDSEWHLLGAAGPLLLPLPARSSFRDFVAGQLVFSLEQAWEERTIPAGALLSLDLALCLAEPRSVAPEIIVAPGAREAIEDVATTRSRLLVTLYRNVRGAAVAYRFDSGRWIGEALKLPEHASVHLITSSRQDDRAFLDVASYLTPNALYLADLAASTAEAVKSLPPRFAAADLVTEQFEAVSADGTKVPYFRRAPQGFALRRHDADAALRLWRLRGVADPVLFWRARQALVRTRRRLCRRQYTRRRRVRSGLAPRRAEATNGHARSRISSPSPRI